MNNRILDVVFVTPYMAIYVFVILVSIVLTFFLKEGSLVIGALMSIIYTLSLGKDINNYIRKKDHYMATLMVVQVFISLYMLKLITDPLLKMWLLDEPIVFRSNESYIKVMVAILLGACAVFIAVNYLHNLYLRSRDKREKIS